MILNQNLQKGSEPSLLVLKNDQVVAKVLNNLIVLVRVSNEEKTLLPLNCSKKEIACSIRGFGVTVQLSTVQETCGVIVAEPLSRWFCVA
ncbi:hypothetical protein Csa_010245 [Cucumis sativus]|uniref:Uncharacterized protein n=1 Tax=Cucumis sativus TaxID=3659 RepID=A0A0A0L7R2_CUCSA|nr:hypothetical protein Csa_010245 [Cucumis sativus]